MREYWKRPGNREKKLEAQRRRYWKMKNAGEPSYYDRYMTRFSRHHVTREAFEALVIAQGGACAICLKPGTWETLCVDHDHACCPGFYSCGKCIRGALCRGCNGALGKMNDDTRALQRAIEYLQSAPKKRVNNAT